MSRVVRWSMDGAAAVAVPVPDDWTRGRLCMGLCVLDRYRCTATLLESSCVPAADCLARPKINDSSSASGSSKGRHTTAAAATAMQLSCLRSPLSF